MEMEFRNIRSSNTLASNSCPASLLNPSTVAAGAGNDAVGMVKGQRSEERIMTEHEKMLAGQLYDPMDPELVAVRAHARDLCQALNATPEAEQEGRRRILHELFGAAVIQNDIVDVAPGLHRFAHGVPLANSTEPVSLYPADRTDTEDAGRTAKSPAKSAYLFGGDLVFPGLHFIYGPDTF
jgi:Maltose acetyltransferase